MGLPQPFRRISLRTLGQILAACLPVTAFAQAQAPTADLGASLVQMLLGLGVVLALMFGALWLLKRLAPSQGQAGGLMRIVAGIGVGTRERVVILEIGTSWLVLGVAPGRITALAELPRQALPPASPGSANPPGWLAQLIRRRHAPRP